MLGKLFKKKNARTEENIVLDINATEEFSDSEYEAAEEPEEILVDENEDAPAEDVELREEVYTMEKGAFTSHDGKTAVSYYVFSPLNCEARGVIQLCHGMCEYVLRYEHLARELCKRGFVFCGNDHLGHGYTAENDEELGFTAEGGGAAFMVQDVHRLTCIIKKKYAGLPVVLLGHSMGSFIARLYMEHYASELSAAIISGTGGPESPAALGKKLAKIVMVKKGERDRSELLDKLAFGKYNKKFKEPSPNAWLSRDEEVQNKYSEDKFCNYKFTARGFYDLFDMLGAVSKKKWAKRIPSELPILMISGDMDPVGNYGKGVRKVYDRLAAAGVEDVTLRLYVGGRHELFNEINKEVVIRNTVEWIEEHIFEEDLKSGSACG